MISLLYSDLPQDCLSKLLVRTVLSRQHWVKRKENYGVQPYWSCCLPKFISIFVQSEAAKQILPKRSSDCQIDASVGPSIWIWVCTLRFGDKQLSNQNSLLTVIQSWRLFQPCHRTNCWQGMFQTRLAFLVTAQRISIISPEINLLTILLWVAHRHLILYSDLQSEYLKLKGKRSTVKEQQLTIEHGHSAGHNW